MAQSRSAGRRRQWMRRVAVRIVLLAAVTLPSQAATVQAAPLALAQQTSPDLTAPYLAAAALIDPREIALTPADLQPGFTIDVGVSGVAPLPDSVGVSLRQDMRRPATPQALADGPIIVQQVIVRLDAPVAPESVLASVRDELIQDAGLAPTPEGPNDGGTVTLKRVDGDITLFSIGFVKQNMVVFTTVGGHNSVISFQQLVDLAGISSARLDATLVQRS